MLQATTNFVYDGWNLVAETDGSGVVTKTFAWGLDLSGSLQGAGGAGGLLLVRDVADSKNYYSYADGNGNVSKLVTGTTGTIVAEYEYSPFGEVLVQSGEATLVNPIQWSSKYADIETKLSYYGFRFYNPTLGRWISRDTIGERGGMNLYCVVGNNPVSRQDFLGLIGVGDILSNFFAPFGSEQTWIMGKPDSYTKIVREWGPVVSEVDIIMGRVSSNPQQWKNSHMTTASWRPGPNEMPDPASGYNSNVQDPPGTDPETAQREFINFVLWGIESDTLHTSAIGSFRMHSTIDKIDIACKTATLNIWMSNTMDRTSFGHFADHWAFTLSAMRPQHMWWNWKQEFTFDGHGGFTPTTLSSGGKW